MKLNQALLALLLCTGQAMAHGSLHNQIQDLTKTMLRDGKSAPLLVKRGRLHMEHGNHKSATQDFLLALKLNPAERSAYYYLAEQAFDQEKLPDARRYAEKFLAMLKGEPGAIVRGQSLYGQILLAQGEYGAAETAFRIAVDQASDPSPEHYLRLADAQGKAGATTEALSSLDEGMRKLGMLNVLQNKSISLNIESRAWDDALQRLDGMILQGQGLPELYLRKARILLAADRQVLAQEAVQQGLVSIEQIPAARRETPAMKQVQSQLLVLRSER
ncbi:Tetratricopeptide repeat-containing protein [Duganella sp. CF458]|uniref:tetratricopeptide repeat protein n=1 Tax=Duganella sp. CF458 TaxID=1884368 RepID=UPI0008EBACC9|nr:tetratricopeptide repeat protein [Duganella sp. CF458]SFG82591.1 Tetratricopeptide repeat-containing protein [Duganella sp. CF458]